MAQSAELSRYWTPDRTREFTLKVGTFDITNDLYKLTIMTSVDVPYQTFILELFLDPNDIILEKIYGQTPIELTAKLYGEVDPRVPEETINFELMYIDSEHPMVMLVQRPETTQNDRQPITITAVSRPAYQTMTTMVNEVFQATRIETALRTLVSNAGGTLLFDSSNRNNEVIDQMLIPPSTLYQCIKYINRTWGIYNGAPAIYCLYDNTVHIINMSAKIKNSNRFSIWQFALDSDNKDEINKSISDVFYTVNPIDTKYRGNAVFSTLAPNMKHIVKPRDRLYYTIDIDLESFSKDYGIIAKNDQIFYDNRALGTTRTKIYKDHTGYDLSQLHINANYSTNIAALTDMKITIEQSFEMFNLMRVGEAVRVQSKIESSAPVVGKYIMRGTEISFTKAKDWESAATMYLIRTNRTVS